MSKRSKTNKANIFASTTTQVAEVATAPEATATPTTPATDDVPPGAEAAAAPVVTEKPKMTEAEKKAHRSAKRKERRVAKMLKAGKVPLAERPRTANGALIPKDGGARKFCFDVQVANGFPVATALSALMQAAAVGTAFANRPKRWFARRAWRNARLYTAGTTEAQVAETVETGSDA